MHNHTEVLKILIKAGGNLSAEYKVSRDTLTLSVEHVPPPWLRRCSCPGRFDTDIDGGTRGTRGGAADSDGRRRHGGCYNEGAAALAQLVAIKITKCRNMPTFSNWHLHSS